MTKKEMKAAVDKLKMLQNGKAALEGMTEADCLELFGISRAQALSDLDLLTIGMVNEMFIEKDNDDATYEYKAQQSDFDSF